MVEEDLKWQKLLWAIVFALSIYLLIRVLFVKPHEVLGFYPYFFLGWWINVPLGMLALGLRLVKVFKNGNFIYALIGAINLVMGVLDIYFLIRWPGAEIKVFLVAVLPLIFSIFIIPDFLQQNK